MRTAPLVLFLLGWTSPMIPAADSPLKFHTDPATGATLAVVAPSAPLIHTAPVTLKSDADPKTLLTELDRLLTSAGAVPNGTIKLNVMAASAAHAKSAHDAIAKHYPAANRPAVTVAIGKLANPQDGLAIDAVALGTKAIPRTANVAVLPAGPRAYISGQAEKGATVSEATAKTLASLVKTIEFLGGTKDDAIQAKCFLNPMTAVMDVVKEFDSVFGANALPIVFLEWQSGGLPIEIELIVKCPKPPSDGAAIEFLTPPGMTASPIYARVTRLAATPTIFTAGLVSEKPGTGADEVRGIFAQLQKIAEQTGTDFKHLAKATYLVSGNDASQKLNEIRPQFYDPRRPPAASKAMIQAVGVPDRTLMIDMIAVPKR